MTKRTIVILTKCYPFGNGEEYLNNELAFISHHFHNVIVYPNDFYGSVEEHSRDLPPNVQVLHLNSYIGTLRPGLSEFADLIRITVNEIMAFNGLWPFLKDIRKNVLNLWTQIILAGTFIKYYLHSLPVDTIYYSYWFHKSAILLSILTERGVINGFVTRAHSVDLYHSDWGLLNDQIRVPGFKMFKLKHVTKILPVSEHGAHYLKKKYPQLNSKIKRWYLGVTPATFKGIKAESVFTVVTCSGNDLNKRIFLIPEALRNISEPVRWVHFGGNIEDCGLTQRIKNLPPNILVDFKGITPNSEILQYYAINRLNVFLNLSQVEGLPVSIMEAMAHGIPAIATNVNGTPEAVIDGVTGFLIPVNFTKQQLTEKIRYCMSNPGLLEEMGKASRELWSRKFNAEINFNDFAEYLKTK